MRPTPAAAAAVRVCGGAVAALLRLRSRAGPRHAALDAVAVLPVVGRARARMAGTRGRPTRVRGWPEPPGAAARSARRWAFNTEIAALPAAADWPNLREL